MSNRDNIPVSMPSQQATHACISSIVRHACAMRAVLPGDLEPCRCTCTGEGLAHATAGQLASFRIHTLDGFGNTRTPGGDAFRVSARATEEGSQPEAVAGRVEDLGQGMYRAAYTATVAGSYEVAVTALNGETSLNASGPPLWSAWGRCRYQQRRKWKILPASCRAAVLCPTGANVQARPLRAGHSIV